MAYIVSVPLWVQVHPSSNQAGGSAAPVGPSSATTYLAVDTAPPSENKVLASSGSQQAPSILSPIVQKKSDLPPELSGARLTQPKLEHLTNHRPKEPQELSDEPSKESFASPKSVSQPPPSKSQHVPIQVPSPQHIAPTPYTDQGHAQAVQHALVHPPVSQLPPSLPFMHAPAPPVASAPVTAPAAPPAPISANIPVHATTSSSASTYAPLPRPAYLAPGYAQHPQSAPPAAPHSPPSNVYEYPPQAAHYQAQQGPQPPPPPPPPPPGYSYAPRYEPSGAASQFPSPPQHYLPHMNQRHQPPHQLPAPQHHLSHPYPSPVYTTSEGLPVAPVSQPAYPLYAHPQHAETGYTADGRQIISMRQEQAPGVTLQSQILPSGSYSQQRYIALAPGSGGMPADRSRGPLGMHHAGGQPFWTPPELDSSSSSPPSSVTSSPQNSPEAGKTISLHYKENKDRSGSYSSKSENSAPTKMSAGSGRIGKQPVRDPIKLKHRVWLQQNRVYQDKLYAAGFRVLEGTNGSKVCSLCNKHFPKEMFVWRHALSHVNEKPFHCTVCDQKFTRSDTLQRHIRRAGHHGIAGNAMS